MIVASGPLVASDEQLVCLELTVRIVCSMLYSKKRDHPRKISIKFVPSTWPDLGRDSLVIVE